MKAFIAIHNTHLGPAIGGCRILPYNSSSEAISDVLRLSQGMTYKCAIAGIPYGGGKSVILADPKIEKTKELLHAMGDFVESLNGQYITSFDTGTTLTDIRTIAERTEFVGGIRPGADNASQSTAYGVFICIERAVNDWLYRDHLSGIRVAIQGAGNVGARLARLLVDAGAIVYLADTDRKKAIVVAAETGAKLINTAQIHALDVDVFAPCALGGIISHKNIKDIKARIIAGGANNQLASENDAKKLADSGILYCPDYLVNAGGIIDLHHQRSDGTQVNLDQHLKSLADTLSLLIDRSKNHAQTTLAIANRMVRERLKVGV